MQSNKQIYILSHTYENVNKCKHIDCISYYDNTMTVSPIMTAL